MVDIEAKWQTLFPIDPFLSNPPVLASFIPLLQAIFLSVFQIPSQWLCAHL
jgi:hypothetical protein